MLGAECVQYYSYYELKAMLSHNLQFLLHNICLPVRGKFLHAMGTNAECSSVVSHRDVKDR